MSRLGYKRVRYGTLSKEDIVSRFEEALQDGRSVTEARQFAVWHDPHLALSTIYRWRRQRDAEMHKATVADILTGPIAFVDAVRCARRENKQRRAAKSAPVPAPLSEA